MKSKLILLVIAYFFTSINLVFAQADFSTVKNSGTQQNPIWENTSTFEFNQRPWLRITVPETSFFDTATYAYWNFPSLSLSYQTANKYNFITDFIQPVGDNKLYIALTEDYWNSVARKVGDWNVSAATIVFANSGAPSYSNTLTAHNGNATFHINPEPVSCTLFLLGGGALAVVGKLRRKKA